MPSDAKDDQPSPEASAPARAPEGMAGLAKGLAVIESFGKSHEHLTVTSAAKITGLTRATARRCLLTLADLGYVVKNGSQFRPTPRMLRLSAAYFETASLPQLAHVHLENAKDELRESVSLAVLEQGYAVFVARSETDRIVSGVAAIGQRLPAYASATGRVLLSFLPDDQLTDYLDQTKLISLTPATITDRAILLERIHKARENLVEVTNEELEEGLVSMAVPVVDQNGNVTSAMSMSASSARISVERMRQEYLPVLRKHADRLSQSL